MKIVKLVFLILFAIFATKNVAAQQKYDCPDCRGTGEKVTFCTDSKCHGGSIYCANCSYSGTVKQKCNSCNGSGVVKQRNGLKVKCSSCGGKGTVSGKCPQCDGKGSYPCPACKGGGSINEHCSRCGGSGVISTGKNSF